MEKDDLLFYNEYEQFYLMAKDSEAFKHFCRKAFGEDFSQDGFSNIEQINMILPYIPKGEDVHILDIGCGNGKMLGYLQKRTNAFIHGFDYSENAISTARELYPEKSDFRVGVIGETDYPENSFDTDEEIKLIQEVTREEIIEAARSLQLDTVFILRPETEAEKE